MSQAKIAITHAGGLLAEALLASMTESGISPDSVILLDVSEQAGNRLPFANTYINVQDQYEFDYEDLVAVLLLQQDAELESLLQHADCYVLSHFAREEGEAPVDFSDFKLPPTPQAIRIADAEASTLLAVVKPLQALSKLASLQVVNLVSASSYGKSAVDELATQTISLLNSREIQPGIFPLQLAFNMIPQAACADSAEHLAALLGSGNTRCSVQTLTVAAFHGLAISVQMEFEQALELSQIEAVLDNLDGVRMETRPVSPVTDCQSGSDLLVYGLCQPQKDANRLQFWIIADSVRNGLVKNYLIAIQFLLKSYL